jgi:hypothetical protein
LAPASKFGKHFRTIFYKTYLNLKKNAKKCNFRLLDPLLPSWGAWIVTNSHTEAVEGVNGTVVEEEGDTNEGDKHKNHVFAPDHNNMSTLEYELGFQVEENCMLS